MGITKIAGPLVVQSGPTGGAVTFALSPNGGGSSAKVAHYDLKILQCTDLTNTRFALALACGPHGTASASHSTPISTAAPPSTTPGVLAGDADTSKVLGEYLHVSVTISTLGGATSAATIEVYEIRKPF